jgi:tetratricopeptide (TPR) repeat protein
MPNQAIAEDSVDLLMWRAADLQQQDKWLHAVQIYRRVIDEYPTHTPAYVYLASIFASRDQSRAAQDILRMGLIQCPDDPKLNLMLGNIHLTDGDFDRAVTQYRNVLKHDHGNSKALHNIGLALARSGRNAEAISYLTKLQYAKPDYPGLAELLGGTYLAVGHLDRALSVLMPADNRDPDNPLILYLIGRALAGMERWEEAEARLHRSVVLNPDDAESLRALGWVLVKLQNLDEAEEWLTKAVQQNPDFLYAHMNLAVVYLMLGKTNDGWATLETARRLDPQNERLATFMQHWNDTGEPPDIRAIEGSYGTRSED